MEASKEDNTSLKDSFFSFLPLLFIEKGIEKEIRHLAKYEYFLFLIYSKQLELETFVPISNRYIKRVIRQQLITRIKNNLISLGIIECNKRKRFEVVNGKTIGKEPFGYRITPKYFVPIKGGNQSTNGYGLEELNKTTDSCNLGALYNGYGFDEKIKLARKKFQDKVIRAQKSRWDHLLLSEKHPEYKYIYRNTLKLEIDLSVYSWIDEEVAKKRPLKDSRCEFVNNKGQHVIYTQKGRFLNEKIGEDWKAHALKIQAGVFQFSCPVTVNRVFYNVTSMPSDLRAFLKFQGQKLSYLDYSNFQPFLLIKSLNERFGACPPADVQRYIELTSSGKFYSEMEKSIKTAGLKVTENQFKVDFFGRVFFSSEKRNYKYRKVFDVIFPNVSEVISEIKKNNYKNLSIQLQKLESEIVINGVIRFMAINYPESFVIPVHDAILCEPVFENILHQIMVTQVEKVVGYKPNIKTTSGL